MSSQTGGCDALGMMYRGAFTISVENDALLRFALKEAYRNGEESLELYMED